MILEELYKISLERREQWVVWIGSVQRSPSDPPLRIEQLESFIKGLRQASEALEIPDSEFHAFYQWLDEVKKAFPTEGWAGKLLKECKGDHVEAISRFWALIHEYLFLTKPNWFIELNSVPLPSRLRGFANEPYSADIRNQAHVQFVTGRSE